MCIEMIKVSEEYPLPEEPKSDENELKELLNEDNKLTCQRCSWQWKPKKKDKLPERCPNCTTKYWNHEKVRLHCALCRYEWIQKAHKVPEWCPRCGSSNWNDEILQELDECLVWLEKLVES